MTLDDWQALTIVCGAILAVAAVAVLIVKVVRRAWHVVKLFNRLGLWLDQALGKPGQPGLMEQVAGLNEQVVDIRRQLDAHLRWHGHPGDRPARPMRPQPNGDQPGAHRAERWQ